MNAYIELSIIVTFPIIFGCVTAYIYCSRKERKVQRYIDAHSYLLEQQNELLKAIDVAENQYDEWYQNVVESMKT